MIKRDRPSKISDPTLLFIPAQTPFTGCSRQHVPILSSIGVDEFDASCTLNGPEFLHRVDQLLYEAKKTGTGRIVHPEIDLLNPKAVIPGREKRFCIISSGRRRKRNKSGKGSRKKVKANKDLRPVGCIRQDSIMPGVHPEARDPVMCRISLISAQSPSRIVYIFPATKYPEDIPFSALIRPVYHPAET
jgi:hypothetical protein